jgi:hypothetical protein
MDGILSRVRDNDKSVAAIDMSTRDELDFAQMFPEEGPPDSQAIPESWRTALQKNNQVRELCLYASFLDTVDQDPARQSRFAVLLELFSYLQSLRELEIHAFSVPTLLFPVVPLVHLLMRQASSLRKLAMYNIRSEGIVEHTEGFRWQLAQAIASMKSLEELVWEPFPLEASSRLQEGDREAEVVDAALVAAILSLPKLRRLSLCAKSVNMLTHPLERLPLSRRVFAPLWTQSSLTTVHLTGYSLTSDDLRVLLGISKRRPSPQRQLIELHMSQCILEEPVALLEYLKDNTSLRRLVLTDSFMGMRSRSDNIDESDPYQQRDFLREVTKILECQNTTLEWVVTRDSPNTKESHSHLRTLLALNRSGLRHVSLRPELAFLCPQQMWPNLVHKVGETSPTATFDLLQRNFEALFVSPPPC